MKISCSSRFFAEAIPVIAFNLVFFWLVNDITLSRWIAWTCLHIAYSTYVITLRGIEPDDRKTVFGYPKADVVFALLLATITAFAVIFIVNPMSEKWAVLIEVLLTSAIAVMYFSLDVAEDATRENNEVQKNHYAFIATAAQKIYEVRKSVTNEAEKKALERAYDAIRSGNVRSVQAAAEIEGAIAMKVERLIQYARIPSRQNEMLSVSSEIEAAMKRRETIIRNSRFSG